MRFFLVATASLFLPHALFAQDDAGSAEKELFGDGVANSVTVHDDSGSPIPVRATVALLLGLTYNLYRLKPLSDPQDVNKAT